MSYLFTALMSMPVSALDAAKEYEIKAAFLFHLGSFVTWADKTLPVSQKNFRICVFGRDPFGERLDVITANQSISGRAIQVLRFNTLEEIDICQVVFISASEEKQLDQIFIYLKGKPILTVGDINSFVMQGGMVQFFPRENKIRLMLDPQAFTEAGLKASAHLLRIAQLVNK